MKRIITLTLSAVSIQLSAFAQGPLTPPGPPAPTMKTLDQVEARTPITNATGATISAPGSYYLTTNITVATGNAITITSDNVTLDLNGFSLISTNPFATGDGVLLSGSQRFNITILNGHIVSSFQTAGIGFDSGIFGTFPSNIRVSGVTVSQCRSNGIALGAAFNGNAVQSCAINSVGSVGITAGTVSDSIALNCNVTAISATTVQNCYADAGVTGNGILATTVLNSYGDSIGSGTGISGSTVENCRGITFTGVGISATTAHNCYGVANTSGTGLQANVATSCEGQSASGIGLNCVFTASECYGITTNAGAVALKVLGTANVCSGQNNGGGIAIQAAIGIGCTTFGGTTSIPPAQKFLGTP
jgi:hypothetical protein